MDIFQKKRIDKTRRGGLWCQLADYLNNKKYKSFTKNSKNEIYNDYELVQIDDINDDYLVVMKKFFAIPIKNKKNGKTTLIVDTPFKRLPCNLLQTYIEDDIIVTDKKVIEDILKEQFIKDNRHIINNPQNFINDMVSKAALLNASDIYLTWTKNDVIIKYRINNYLDSRYFDYIDKDFAEHVRLSLIHLSNENEFSTKPIDGKFGIYVNNEYKEFRLSIGKTQLGYAIVIRLYQEMPDDITLEDLGYTEKAISIINKILHKRYGMFLITGSTGSGKTTTIYTIIKNRMKEENLIIKTVEDPVEMIIDGVDQFQINTKGDKENWFTYNSAIRMFLRQKPDIMVIGEVRDEDVAESLIRAAFTGHFVMSTLHTGSVKATIARLFDLGIRKDQIEDTLIGILNQILVPKLCNNCKIRNDDGTYRVNRNGCEVCRNNKVPGYNGMIVVAEIANIPLALNNYKLENFEDYYSLEENFDELIKKGIVDKNTALKYSNYKEYIEKLNRK